MHTKEEGGFYIQIPDGMTTEEAVNVLNAHQEIGYAFYAKIPEGMKREEAVRYIEHGPEMASFIRACTYLPNALVSKDAKNLLAKLEG
jgi:hypothetical protein